jgi:hypothetical protein
MTSRRWARRWRKQRTRRPARSQFWRASCSCGPACPSTRRRIQARDQAKGRSQQEVDRRIDRRYFPAQDRYRAEHDPVGRAQVIIDNEDWRRPQVVRRAPDLPPSLSAALDAVLRGEA